MKRIGGIACLIALVVLCAAMAVDSAEAQTLSALYSFNNTPPFSDPLGFIFPGTLAQGRDGNVYSTSSNGGSQLNSGSFFSMSPAGGLSVLYGFDPNVDAGCSSPWSGVMLGSDGNFYGALFSCSFGFGSGYVFSITPTGGLNLLYNFTGGSDGSNPAAAPVEGTDGNFYGTTIKGGGSDDCGTIYQMTPAGVLTTLHTFDRTDGCASYAPLVQGNDGNFYGVTAGGGSYTEDGVVFKVTPLGAYSVIHNFNGLDGSNPFGPLALGSDGNFYGTASGSGTGNTANGVVFRITPAGKFKILHTFHTDTGDGYAPLAGLVLATDGYFYGVTSQGGTSTNCAIDSTTCGTIFRINAKAGSYTVLSNFDFTTGESPFISMVQHTNGTLYGLATFGGTYDSGTYYSFNVALSPFVKLVSTSGPVGSTIGILGQGLTGTKKVLFGGVSASFTVVSDTYLTATVPVGATLGFVTVKTPGGALKSNRKFRVTQ